MIRTKLASFAAGLVLLVAGTASAQVTAQLTAPNAPGSTPVISGDGTYYDSPYTGTVNGVPNITLNCVDFFHDVLVGQVWQANVTNLGDVMNSTTTLASTRDGSIGNPSGAPVANALTLYQQAAWLTTQYGSNPGGDPSTTRAIQTAIWSLLDPGFGGTNQSISGSANPQFNTVYWVNAAQTYAPVNDVAFYSQFNVLTDVNAKSGGVQEFIYSTPEPGTLALLGTGLMSLSGLGLGMKRKRLAV